VVINLKNERNLVRVLTSEESKHTQGAGNSVGTAFDRELDNVFWVKKGWVLGKRCARGVFDALVDREDRGVTGAGKATVVHEALKVTQNRGGAIGALHDVVDPVRTCCVDLFFGDSLTAMLH